MATRGPVGVSGSVSYTEAVPKDIDTQIKAIDMTGLCDIILTNLNEMLGVKDAYNAVMSYPTPVFRIQDISTSVEDDGANMVSNLTTAKNNAVINRSVTANDINRIITAHNKLRTNFFPYIQIAHDKQVSMSEVFNNWKRFSHHRDNDQPANISNMNSWTYDNVNGRIVCTSNIGTYCGFISPYKFDNYTHEVTLKSADDDDDTIGVIIAFGVKNGREYTLNALRIPHTNHQDHDYIVAGSRWLLVYNYQITGERLLANGDAFMTGGKGNWNNWPTGTRVRIEREGDIIRAYTSQMNSEVIDPATKLEINLADLVATVPDIAVFRGRKPFGYSSISQNKATFTNVTFQFPLSQVDLSTVVDVPAVIVNNPIKQTTFDLLCDNLKVISMAFDFWDYIWNDTNYCLISCQTSCQSTCQIACQSCYSGTCHNQNCGGWS